MVKQQVPEVGGWRDRLRGALKQRARVEPLVRDDNVTGLMDLSTLGGRWFQSPHGPGYVIDSVYEGGHQHGAISLHRALDVDLAALARQGRDERLAGSAPDRFLFIDTETTGMGGAGSLVFLAGVARFEGASLRLRQFLLPSPVYEGGLMGGLAEEIERAAALVSYNGKSFDLPQLEARAILSRTRLGLRNLPHLDLLHPNRRLFKGEFASHRLPEMEVRLLEFQREDDCPSAEVPERYFAFQRSGDASHIAPVLRHNAWDILSLVALTARLAADCAGEGRALQAARAADYGGDYARAASFYASALAETTGRASRTDLLERMAECHRKLGDHAGAAACWEAILRLPRNRHLRPYVELAKIREHRERRFDAALALVVDAIGLLERGLVRPGAPGSEVCLDALRRRRERLRRRAGH